MSPSNMPASRDVGDSSASSARNALDVFRLGNKILFLRLFRLGHLPSALYSAELMRNAGLPVLAIEYGNEREDSLRTETPIPRERFESPWAASLPRPLRAATIFAVTLARIAWRIALEGHPRLIIAHGLHEQCMAYLLGRIFGVPYAVHVHEFFSREDSLSPFNRLLFAMEGRALGDARFLIFPEVGRERVYRERYALKCPTIIAYNCPRLRVKGPIVDLRAQHGLPADAKLMLYIGGIGAINALEEAVAALPHVPNLHLLLVGWSIPEYVARLRDLAAELDVEQRVVFVGEVEDKWEYLDNCDISYCVYRPTTLRTRHLATASNKFTEALAAGLPVITTANEDFRSLVDKFEIGATVPEISGRAIAAAVQRVLARRPEMAENARGLHEREFHYEVQYVAIEAEVRAITGIGK